jgi:UDP-N-acetyl-D-mannosaminuronic acid dehydrogenase
VPLTIHGETEYDWMVEQIAVVGPGIVGMPMAALLARAEIKIGTDHAANVVVVQRPSPTSGWKVNAINSGKSPIGGVEPGLDEIVAGAVSAGTLSATSDPAGVRDSDVVLICVQTDRDGFAPDYGPLMSALDGVCAALSQRPPGNVPVIIFESTLAPSTMTTLVRDRFAKAGLVEGRDVLLGNSPNRVMPGRLVDRVESQSKLAGGLHPLTPKLIERLYGHVVTRGTVHPTNSLTAEIVKTLENAYRDVRIAYAAEVARHCDAHDIDFFALRDAVNESIGSTDTASADPTAVPSAALLVPLLGVGGHCLPKDGILLWWRAIESKQDQSRSVILAARHVNDESPELALERMEAEFGPLRGTRVAILGAAYRFDSEDTRNSPSFVLAKHMLGRGIDVVIQDPHVRPEDPNLTTRGLDGIFTRDLPTALEGATGVVIGTGHAAYADEWSRVSAGRWVFDGGNLYRPQDASRYAGIGRGIGAPDAALVADVVSGFRIMAAGVANELEALIAFLNEHFASSPFEAASLDTVRDLAASCTTGCDIAVPADIQGVPAPVAFESVLVECARPR